MASLKRSYTKTTLLDLSAKIMDRLEETDLFQQASCIALYHAIPGEVQTAGLIEKWYRKKRLLLPLIKGNDLQVIVFPRNNVIPEKGMLLLTEDNDRGIEYRNVREYGTWILEFGSRTGKRNRPDHCSGCRFRPPA